MEDFENQIKIDHENFNSLTSNSECSFVDENYLESDSNDEKSLPSEENILENFIEYIPATGEQIICIELSNNNRIYLNYKSHWKLFNEIFNHREFKKLYNNKNFFTNNSIMNNIFDLNLIIFRSIKDETDSKIDKYVSLSYLQDLGLLKSYKFPFFYLSDSRNFNKICKKEQILKVYENSIKNKNFKILTHLDLIYRDYLPRNYISFTGRNKSSDITDLYNFSKKSVNVFTKLELDPLIGNGSNKIDWFIYDDESLAFLMQMDNFEFTTNNNIKIFNNQIYFQDNLPYIILSNKEYRSIIINIWVNNDVKMKIGVELTLTPKEIFKKIISKLEMSKSDFTFDSNPDAPIGLSSYITDCVKNNVMPQLIIVNNPFLAFNRRRSSSHNNSSVKIEDLLKNKITSVPNTNLFSAGKNKNFLNLNPAKDCPVKLITNTDKDKDKTPIKILSTKDDLKISNNSNLVDQSQSQIKKTSTFKATPKLSKNNINNVAIFNPDIIKFSNFKGLRNRITQVDLDVTSDKHTTDIESSLQTNQDFDCLDFNKIMMNCIQKKLNDEKDKSNLFHKTQNLEVNVDDLIENKRKRTKGIEDRKTKPKRYSRRRDTKETKDCNHHLINENNEMNTFKLEEQISIMNSNISLRNINRNFNFKLHLVKLRDNFLKNLEINYPQQGLIDLEIKFKMYCGMKSISNGHKIFWKGISNDVTALINKRLYFDINYCNLPLVSSLIFKIKTLVKNPRPKKDNKLFEKKTIAWLNFRIFDHTQRLKTGIHKVYLWDSKFSDDSFFSNVDNYQDKIGEMYFELESFMRPVEYKIISNPIFDHKLDTAISEKDDSIINRIEIKSPLEDLTEEEKEVIWRNRKILMKNPNFIVKILSSINVKEIGLFSEIDDLLATAKSVNCVQAIELLSGNFLNDSIRSYAVYSLQQVSYLELTDYVPQLVQCLKYEMYHDSPLANFLLKIAIKHPLTIGHHLFWSFKGEMYNANVQQRFGLYLQIFLNKIGEDIRKIFEDELWLLDNLLKISDLGFIKNASEEEKNSALEESLNKLNHEFMGRSISVAYNFKLRVKGIKSKKCKFMKSKKKPLWIVFENSDENGDDIYVMFKKGDDLRQDIITLQLFKIMHNMWFNEGTKLKMSLYNCISTGYFQGMLQIVTNSETLAKIHKDYGGLSMGFSNKPLKQWMAKVITKLPETEYVNNFMLSCAAYCVATFVLGIGDRHNDNIMIKENGEIFHIDFGHFLGHFKYKFGIKRERAPFIFTSEFLNVFGGEKSEIFAKFKQLCIQSYQVLRKNVHVLITLLKAMLCTGIPELTNNSIKFLAYSLALNLNDSDAEKFLLEKLDQSMNSFSTKLNFAIHIIANK